MARRDVTNRVMTANLPAPATRMISLDVFRGLTMAAMVIVNNPGDWGNVYPPLLHATWNGATPTDLIFPFFLFIVGVSTTLSKKTARWGSIVRRALIIIALGLLLAIYPGFDVATWRFPGVLQRIGICYLIAAGAYHATAGDRRRQGILLGATAVALTVIYWMVMTQVPTPAGIRGDLSPEGNWGAYIDRAVFGSHVYVNAKTWDPEGLLSTVPSIATALFGVVTGLWLGSTARPTRKAAALLAAGVTGMAVGELWSVAFPINKNIWTSSFVFFTAGAACLLLALCHWIIDVKGWRGWTKPFVILGSNAITLYVASGLLVDTLGVIHVTDSTAARVSLSHHIYTHFFVPLASPKNASLLYAVAHLAVMFVLLAWMYRRRMFLRV